MAMNTVKQAMENMEYVRWLLWQKQPGFAASLELAALERKLREPVMAPQNRRHVRSPAAAAPVADLGPAAGLGIGSGHPAVSDQQLARRLLGFPEDKTCAFLIPLGYPAGWPLIPIQRPDRRPFDEIVHRGGW